jgi:peptidoglycan-associated lipoprotein
MLLNKFIILLVVSGAIAGMAGCCDSYDECTSAQINDGNQSVNAGELRENPALPIDSTVVKKVVHFAYNKHDLNAEAEEIIAAHASMLLENPHLRLRVIGHTDERGSQKYNLALGKMRGETVARTLELNGVAANRINILSYGKTQPIVVGRDESACSQNRRVELFYDGDTN